jgi:peptidoglycan/LPS O-acetylase OafA/YrhL
MLSTEGYRPDVDGLRAVAVTWVLVFHFLPGALPGGFVGVDVFFVISGYLITKILLAEIDGRRFSLWAFYQRRVRRIFPALLLVVFASVAAGWYLLFDDEFQRLCDNAVAGLLSLGNVSNWRSTGYFDTASDLMPLLHLWSLGVEEQYYLVWPLILVSGSAASLRWPKLRLWYLVLGVVALSFALNVAWVHTRPSTVFYLPFTRVWELGVGGLLACFRTERKAKRTAHGAILANGLSLLALLALIVAGTCIDTRQPFPGFLALVPVFGTATLIAVGPRAWLNRNLLGASPLVKLGLISYPLYLWHWPLLSFARILQPEEPSPLLLLGLLASALVLAWLTYRFVEIPIRTRAHGPRVTSWTLGATAVLAVFGAACATSVIPARVRPTTPFVQRELAQDRALRHAIKEEPCAPGITVPERLAPFCTSMEGVPGGQTVVLWGDSHARAFSPVIFEIGRKRGLRVVLITHAACAPLLGVRTNDPDADPACRELGLAEDVIRTVATLEPSQIYLGARWGVYAHGWRVRGKLQTRTHFLTQNARGDADQASSLAALNARFLPTVQALAALAPVTLLRSVPTLEFSFEQGSERDPAHFEPTLSEHRARETISDRLITLASQRFPNVRVVDPAALLCQERCRATLPGLLAYSDDNHLTAQATLRLEAELEPTLR